MRKAFTLIEVLISAGIISVVGLALLQTHSHNAKLIDTMTSKYHAKEEFSLVLLNAKSKWDGSSKTLYDMVSTKYSFKDDDTIKWLKSKKLDYTQDAFSSVDLLETDLEDFISSMSGMDKSNLPDITILVDKVSMDTSNGSSLGYIISLK